MYSYEHKYHAGNFADVHKQIALIAILQHLIQKPTPFTVMDTHAGEGWYDLQSDAAKRLKEHVKGIDRFRQLAPKTPLAKMYLDYIQSLNPEDKTVLFPGSAAIIQHFLREQDSAILIEHHPSAILTLKQNMRRDPRIHIHDRDAIVGLPALLPFKDKRGLIFIDPSYEVKAEYEDIINVMVTAYRKFAHGIFVIWYPILPQGHHIMLKKALKKADLDNILIHEWIPEGKQSQGLYGSGLVIINPPWQLDKQLSEIFK